MKSDFTNSTDQEVVSFALEGEDEAFRELVGRHKNFLFRLIRNHVNDPDEALDLLQESFVAAFAAIHRYDLSRSFRIWIARIALNKCRDWARRRSVRSFFSRALSIGDDDFESDAPSPMREVEGRADLLRVEAAIALLPHTLREVLILRAVEEFSQAETAAILGISPKAVEVKLYRARQRLKNLLAGT